MYRTDQNAMRKIFYQHVQGRVQLEKRCKQIEKEKRQSWTQLTRAQSDVINGFCRKGRKIPRPSAHAQRVDRFLPDIQTTSRSTFFPNNSDKSGQIRTPGSKPRVQGKTSTRVLPFGFAYSLDEWDFMLKSCATKDFCALDAMRAKLIEGANPKYSGEFEHGSFLIQDNGCWNVSSDRNEEGHPNVSYTCDFDDDRLLPSTIIPTKPPISRRHSDVTATIPQRKRDRRMTSVGRLGHHQLLPLSTDKKSRWLQGNRNDNDKDDDDLQDEVFLDAVQESRDDDVTCRQKSATGGHGQTIVTEKASLVNGDGNTDESERTNLREKVKDKSSQKGSDSSPHDFQSPDRSGTSFASADIPRTISKTDKRVVHNKNGVGLAPAVVLRENKMSPVRPRIAPISPARPRVTSTSLADQNTNGGAHNSNGENSFPIEDGGYDKNISSPGNLRASAGRSQSSLGISSQDNQMTSSEGVTTKSNQSQVVIATESQLVKDGVKLPMIVTTDTMGKQSVLRAEAAVNKWNGLRNGHKSENIGRRLLGDLKSTLTGMTQTHEIPVQARETINRLELPVDDVRRRHSAPSVSEPSIVDRFSRVHNEVISVKQRTISSDQLHLGNGCHGNMHGGQPSSGAVNENSSESFSKAALMVMIENSRGMDKFKNMAKLIRSELHDLKKKLNVTEGNDAGGHSLSHQMSGMQHVRYLRLPKHLQPDDVG